MFIAQHSTSNMSGINNKTQPSILNHMTNSVTLDQDIVSAPSRLEVSE